MCCCQFKKLNKKVKKLMSQITDLSNAALVALKQANTSLDLIVTGQKNIADDEVNLLKMIQDLKDQLSNGNGVITPADTESLNSLLAFATALSAKTAAVAEQTKTIADSVADLPAPPPQNQ